MKRTVFSFGLFLICIICTYGIALQCLYYQDNVLLKDQGYSGRVKMSFQSDQDIFLKYNSTILNIETYKTDKKSIYIRIPNRLTKKQLEEIATYLRNINKVYDRLFIFYLLPNIMENN